MKKGAKSNIPRIKKKIGAFFVGEEGKISKNSLLKIGGVLTGLSSAALVASATDVVTTVNELHLTHGGSTATGTHENHVSHNNHGNHASHSSY